MERKRVDDNDPGPTSSSRPVDRFGFIKSENSNSPEALKRSKSTFEFERYFYGDHPSCCKDWLKAWNSLVVLDSWCCQVWAIVELAHMEYPL